MSFNVLFVEDGEEQRGGAVCSRGEAGHDPNCGHGRIFPDRMDSLRDRLLPASIHNSALLTARRAVAWALRKDVIHLEPDHLRRAQPAGTALLNSCIHVSLQYG